jgi:hypothetical protein
MYWCIIIIINDMSLVSIDTESEAKIGIDVRRSRSN